VSFSEARDGVLNFFAGFGVTVLNLIFLPHHMLLSLDAIVRSLNRTLISGRNLLDWETAAESEGGSKTTQLDRYLKLSPVLALAVAVALLPHHLYALRFAAPILSLWALAPLAAAWLNSPPRQREGPLERNDILFLQQHALQIWRYYSEFGDARNHWLIPDNVEEYGTLQIRKLSPTNLGMLFNARQAAYEFGFITLSEFAEATVGTLTTYEGLKKCRGHIYNWYDIETLQPIAPFTVSSVDSGNLSASLYTLHTGALELLKRPLLREENVDVVERMFDFGERTSSDESDSRDLRLRIKALLEKEPMRLLNEKSNDEERWLAEETSRRHVALVQFVQQYLPWLLPQFAQLFDLGQLALPEDLHVPTLQSAAAYAAGLNERLAGTALADPATVPVVSLATQLRALLVAAQEKLSKLHEDVIAIAAEAERHAEAMDYGFLLEESRQLLSVGFDGVKEELNSACYDLLASEARIATFLAVAKGDISQQSWFRLERSHTLVDGRAALLSWTGTMFEYMMPALWMRTFPDTLITRSLEAVAQIQRRYVREIPWGISESGWAKVDNIGRYGYQAWGIPSLALKYGAEDGPVISPYSTFLVLPFLRDEALANLRRMVQLGWLGAYGFYEAADYTEEREPRLVRSWMAHHQGMSLLAITNLLHDNVIQRWFHCNPIVRAAELLLHERPLSKATLKELSKRLAPQAAETKKAEVA
jgi:cyclic beta-1,2-glucan synthetase